MRALTLSDILDVESYQALRGSYRPLVIAHKAERRVQVGERVSLAFEDRETLRYQIQEMTRVEGTRDPAKIQVEVDVYNELIPGPDELSATLFIEIPELELIRPELDRLVGIDEHVALVIGDEVALARFDARQMEEDRISAVHYLRFALSPEAVTALAAGAPARLRIDHPNYGAETTISQTLRASLLRDLRDETPALLDLAGSGAPTPELLLETERVRATRHSKPGGPQIIVVEAREADIRLLDADPELLAEWLGTAQRLAAELHANAGACRVRLDLLAGGEGELRIELSVPR